MATPDIFERELQRYRTFATKYKLTGDALTKVLADQQRAWFNAQVAYMEQTAASKSSAINTFVRDYSRTNPDLLSMQSKMKSIKEEGPKMEDVYRTNSEAAETSPRDFTQYYIKGGVILGVGALVAVLSFF